MSYVPGSCDDKAEGLQAKQTPSRPKPTEKVTTQMSVCVSDDPMDPPDTPQLLRPEKPPLSPRLPPKPLLSHQVPETTSHVRPEPTDRIAKAFELRH